MFALSSIRPAALLSVFVAACAYVPPAIDGDNASGGGGNDIGSGGGGGASAVSSSSGAGGADQTGSTSSSSSSSVSSSGSSSASSSSSSGMPPVGFCDPTRPDLLACFRFNGNWDDESGKLNILTPTNITFASGVDGEAANFSVADSSSLIIADADQWDVTSFSVEMWANLRSYPSYRMGLFDSDGRYGMFVWAGGELRCSRGAGTVSLSPMPLDTWIHIACVYTAGDLRLYINGDLISQAATTDPEPGTGLNAVGGNAPSGDSFDGLIDDVRIWSSPRSDQEICLAAGKQGC